MFYTEHEGPVFGLGNKLQLFANLSRLTFCRRMNKGDGRHRTIRPVLSPNANRPVTIANHKFRSGREIGANRFLHLAFRHSTSKRPGATVASADREYLSDQTQHQDSFR